MAWPMVKIHAASVVGSKEALFRTSLVVLLTKHYWVKPTAPVRQPQYRKDPVAAAAAITRAGREGILIEGGLQLEALGRVQAVCFDKTGTLTKGTPQLTTSPPSTAATNARCSRRCGRGALGASARPSGGRLRARARRRAPARRELRGARRPRRQRARRRPRGLGRQPRSWSRSGSPTRTCPPTSSGCRTRAKRSSSSAQRVGDRPPCSVTAPPNGSYATTSCRACSSLTTTA
jgi:hypothetical protein